MGFGKVNATVQGPRSWKLVLNSAFFFHSCMGTPFNFSQQCHPCKDMNAFCSPNPMMNWPSSTQLTWLWKESSVFFNPIYSWRDLMVLPLYEWNKSLYSLYLLFSFMNRHYQYCFLFSFTCAKPSGANIKIIQRKTSSQHLIFGAFQTIILKWLE